MTLLVEFSCNSICSTVHSAVPQRKHRGMYTLTCKVEFVPLILIWTDMYCSALKFWNKATGKKSRCYHRSQNGEGTSSKTTKDGGWIAHLTALAVLAPTAAAGDDTKLQISSIATDTFRERWIVAPAPKVVDPMTAALKDLQWLPSQQKRTLKKAGSFWGEFTKNLLKW